MTHDDDERNALTDHSRTSIWLIALDHCRSLIVAVQFLTRLPTPHRRDGE